MTLPFSAENMINVTQSSFVERVDNDRTKETSLYFDLNELEINRMMHQISFASGAYLSALEDEFGDNIPEAIKPHFELQIHHIDMHHDMFNDNTQIDCGNWLGHICKEYPTNIKWVTNPVSIETYGLGDMQVLTDNMLTSIAELEPVQYDIIFLCRSNSWLPPQLDQDFDVLRHKLLHLAADRYFCQVIENPDVSKPRDCQQFLNQLRTCFSGQKFTDRIR